MPATAGKEEVSGLFGARRDIINLQADNIAPAQLLSTPKLNIARSLSPKP
jgi:hypothetical protein